MLQSSASRQQELDVFRGFAILTVLCFHYTTNFNVMYGTTFGPTLFEFRIGDHGLHLFFMISGYVIFMSLQNTKSILDFIVSRFARLYPAYWFAIIFAFLTIPLAVLPRPHTVHEFLVNFSMLQSFLGVAHLDPVFWTLTVELTFYLFMGIVFATRTLAFTELFGALWLVLMIINKYYSPSVEPLITLSFIFHAFLRCGYSFVMGIFFYKMKTSGPKWWRHLGIAFCLIVQWIIWKDPLASFASVIFIVLFYLFIFNKLKFLCQPVLIFFGTISYSMYLIHQNFGYIVIQWLAVKGFGPLVKFFVPMILCMVIATLMTFLIERPAMAFIKNTYRGLREKRVGRA